MTKSESSRASSSSSGFSRWSLIGQWSLVIGALAFSGCTGKPNQANIQLRKQVQDLQGQIATLQRERDTARAEVAGLRSRSATVQTLPPDRLAKLFTTAGIQLGKLTGGADLDPDRPGDDGLKVYVTPMDHAGQKFKAAGAITVEAFDLAANPTGVGRWQFNVEDAAKHWSGALLRYEYVLPCPFEKPPAHEEITIKVTFTDELTGRVFTQQRAGRVRLRDEEK